MLRRCSGLAAIVFVLSACGQTGPLVLPPPAAEAVAPPATEPITVQPLLEAPASAVSPTSP